MKQETFNFTIGLEDFINRNEGILSLDVNNLYETADTDFNQQISSTSNAQYKQLDDFSKELPNSDFSALDLKLFSSYNVSNKFNTNSTAVDDFPVNTTTSLFDVIKPNFQFSSNYETDLYQVKSNSPSISSLTSTNEYSVPSTASASISSSTSVNEYSVPSTASASIDISNAYTNNLLRQKKNRTMTSKSASQLDTNFQLDKSLKDSPNDHEKHDHSSPKQATSVNCNISVNTPVHSPTRSISISLTPISHNDSASSSRRSSLDSRLSLQKLGEILRTSSMEETIKVEKFVLSIFSRDLGFPLGYKTWIRDTNEKYRSYLLEELHNRVNPTHPQLNKNLLETIIKRATYSMMQGRLRKERRAASKLKFKKKSISK